MTWLCHNQPRLLHIVRPKARYFRHLCFEAAYLSPWLLQRYGDGDMVGRLVKMARLAALGRSQKQIPATLVAKYRVLLAMQLQGLF